MVLAQSPSQGRQTSTHESSCAGDNGGITLSPGFCATIFADNLGHARQMVFGPNGVLYLNTWSGRYYQYDKPPPGGFLDTKPAIPDQTHSLKLELPRKPSSLHDSPPVP
jgi:hypothetical protein